MQARFLGPWVASGQIRWGAALGHEQPSDTHVVCVCVVEDGMCTSSVGSVLDAQAQVQAMQGTMRERLTDVLHL